MAFAFVKIVSEYSTLVGKNYGPFESKEAAAEYLKSNGWSENINGIQGLWYVQNSRYEGINARIELLDGYESLPISITFRESRFMRV